MKFYNLIGVCMLFYCVVMQAIEWLHFLFLSFLHLILFCKWWMLRLSADRSPLWKPFFLEKVKWKWKFSTVNRIRILVLFIYHKVSWYHNVIFKDKITFLFHIYTKEFFFYILVDMCKFFENLILSFMLL